MPICPHCQQPVRTPASRCNRCNWSPLDGQIQTLPLTQSQRFTLQSSGVGWLVILAIMVVSTLIFSSVGLGTRVFVVVLGLLMGAAVTYKLVLPAREDLRQGTMLRRPLPVVGHSVERGEDGPSYHVRFGDVLDATLSRAQHAALVPGNIYWVSYSPHTQRIWDIQPYLADEDPAASLAG